VIDLSYSCSDLYALLFVVFVSGWFGYEMAGFAFRDKLFSVLLYGTYSFVGSIRFVPFFVCILLGISPAADRDLPTFRNLLSVSSSKAGCRVHPGVRL
jgi:hypothetical protein